MFAELYVLSVDLSSILLSNFMCFSAVITEMLGESNCVLYGTTAHLYLGL